MNQYHRPSSTLAPSQIKAIEKALAEKRRVEIVQTAIGLKIYSVMRKEIE